MAAEDTHSSVGAATAEPRGAAPDAPAELHARSFKLRFAAQREQGRSYVSLVKPLGLPATVTGKFYARSEGGGEGAAPAAAAERRALQRIRDMFGRDPRLTRAAPATSSQLIGWYASSAAGAESAALRGDRRLHHHIRDSAWLKARLCVLAADDKLKQR